MGSRGQHTHTRFLPRETILATTTTADKKNVTIRNILSDKREYINKKRNLRSRSYFFISHLKS